MTCPTVRLGVGYDSPQGFLADLRPHRPGPEAPLRQSAGMASAHTRLPAEPEDLPQRGPQLSGAHREGSRTPKSRSFRSAAIALRPSSSTGESGSDEAVGGHDPGRVDSESSPLTKNDAASQGHEACPRLQRRARHGSAPSTGQGRRSRHKPHVRARLRQDEPGRAHGGAAQVPSTASS